MWDVPRGEGARTNIPTQHSVMGPFHDTVPIAWTLPHSIWTVDGSRHSQGLVSPSERADLSAARLSVALTWAVAPAILGSGGQQDPRLVTALPSPLGSPSAAAS